jgi:hypothetical protein
LLKKRPPLLNINMTNKQLEAILLEQAYDSINEGILTRLKGQGSGISAGLKQGVQNVASGVAGKLGAKVTPSGKTMGQAYANAQQKSIFASFVATAKKEIEDFKADIVKLGKADEDALKASHPEIEQVINSYNQLMIYLAGQGANANSTTIQVPRAKVSRAKVPKTKVPKTKVPRAKVSKTKVPKTKVTP